MEIYTVAETAEILSLSYSTVVKMLRKGELHGHKVGRFWRITRADIGELLNATRR